MIHYMLCVSRFSHYVKVMGRDRMGSFQSAEGCEVNVVVDGGGDVESFFQ